MAARCVPISFELITAFDVLPNNCFVKMLKLAKLIIYFDGRLVVALEKTSIIFRVDKMSSDHF